MEEFEKKVNEAYSEDKLVEGYAPFCKHLFVENFTEAKSMFLEITPENEHLIKSDYEARAEYELPVLTRWFPAEKVQANKAQYLDIILYSREQIQKENSATGAQNPNSEVEYDWGIVSIKAQDVAKELPMAPITMLRNALGKEEGGSGIPLDKDKYRQSVDFFKKFAIIR